MFGGDLDDDDDDDDEPGPEPGTDSSWVAWGFEVGEIEVVAEEKRLMGFGMGGVMDVRS